MGLALDLEDYHPSVLLHCWLGYLTCKIVFEMIYNVSSGTLNPTIPYHTVSGTLLTQGREKEADQRRRILADGCKSDHIMLAKAFEVFAYCTTILMAAFM